MDERVPLDRVESLFAELRYPVTRADAAARVADVTVTHPDGEANLGKVVSEVGSDSFAGPEALAAEVRGRLPGGD
jgi:hypothetical protein